MTPSQSQQISKEKGNSCIYACTVCKSLKVHKNNINHSGNHWRKTKCSGNSHVIQRTTRKNFLAQRMITTLHIWLLRECKLLLFSMASWFTGKLSQVIKLIIETWVWTSLFHIRWYICLMSCITNVNQEYCSQGTQNPNFTSKICTEQWYYLMSIRCQAISLIS